MAAAPPPSRDLLFENLVQSAPDALLVVDAEGRIVLANHTAESLFGFARGELAGAPIEQLLPERLRAAHVQHRADYAASPRTREMGATVNDLLAVRRDGAEFPVEIRLSPVAAQGRSYIAAAVRDVTDRRHAVQVLQAAQQQAERANAAKSRFLATASHDLRQPLQALQLLNAALRRQVQDPEAQDLAAREHETIESMSRLLHALLDISRIEAGTVRPDIQNVSLAATFEALRREFEPLARARGLALEVGEAPHYLHSDRVLLRQLLENLLANSIKYTEAGSVRLTCRREADRLAVEVTDTGIGIAPGKLGAIFEEFYQVERGRRQGVGLGLSIVQRIASLLGLGLEVESEPGRGSTFRLCIPAAQLAGMSPLPAAGPPPVQPSLPGSGAVILLVEDDDAVRSATEFYLKTIGHRPIAAPSIAAAEQALQSAPQPPDLIITDYHLGHGETGIQAIARLRQRLARTLPALLLSGDTSAALRELVDARTCRILSKPVDVDDLSNAIAELLAAPA